MKHTLYTIRERTDTDNGCIYRLTLNAGHAIYKAHFPGNPVTPGVCIIQIVRELTSEYCRKNFLMRRIKSVKFVNVINPKVTPQITVPLTINTQEDGMTAVSCNIHEGETVFSKVNLILEEEK